MRIEDIKLEVVEGGNGYYLYATYPGLEDESQEVACMGDGVDVYFYNEAGKELGCGMPGFVETWQQDVDRDPETYIEAYFPELWDKLE